MLCTFCLLYAISYYVPPSVLYDDNYISARRDCLAGVCWENAISPRGQGKPRRHESSRGNLSLVVDSLFSFLLTLGHLFCFYRSYIVVIYKQRAIAALPPILPLISAI